MLKRLTLGLSMLLLAACGSLTGTTPAGDVYAVRSGYNVVLTAAVAYVELPRCGAPTSPRLCSEPKVAEQLVKADLAAKATLDAAENVARNTPGADARTAIAAANEAISAVAAILAVYGKK